MVSVISKLMPEKQFDLWSVGIFHVFSSAIYIKSVIACEIRSMPFCAVILYHLMALYHFSCHDQPYNCYSFIWLSISLRFSSADHILTLLDSWQLIFLDGILVSKAICVLFVNWTKVIFLKLCWYFVSGPRLVVKYAGLLSTTRITGVVDWAHCVMWIGIVFKCWNT